MDAHVNIDSVLDVTVAAARKVEDLKGQVRYWRNLAEAVVIAPEQQRPKVEAQIREGLRGD